MSDKLKEIHAAIYLLEDSRNQLLTAIKSDENSLVLANTLNLDGSPYHSMVAELSLRDYVKARLLFHRRMVTNFTETLDELRDLYREESKKI